MLLEPVGEAVRDAVPVPVPVGAAVFVAVEEADLEDAGVCVRELVGVPVLADVFVIVREAVLLGVPVLDCVGSGVPTSIAVTDNGSARRSRVVLVDAAAMSRLCRTPSTVSCQEYTLSTSHGGLMSNCTSSSVWLLPHCGGADGAGVPVGELVCAGEEDGVGDELRLGVGKRDAVGV